MLKFVKILTAAAVAITMMAATAAAQTTSTLDTIIERGKIIVGISLSNPPFGYLDPQLQPVGFDVAMAKMIARDLGVELEIADQQSQSRIPNLTAGNIDIVISSLGVTAERAKTIMFTNTIYLDELLVVAPTSIEIAGFEDLVGKRVGVTRTTTNDTVLTENAHEGTNIMRFEDDAAVNQALFSGQVDAIVAGAAQASAIRSQTDAYERKFASRQSPMAIGVRRGDAELHQWLNTEIMLLWSTGEIQAAQREWIGVVNEDMPRF